MTLRRNPDYHPVRIMTQTPRTTRFTRLLRPASAILAAFLVGTILVPALRANVPHRKRKDLYKEQVEQLEQTWRTAQLAGDVGEMDKLLADDYVGITMTGQVVTKMQQLDRLRNRSMVLTRIDLDDMKVKLIGSTAIVTSLASIDGTNEGTNVHGTYRYTRVYTRLPTGIWKITNFEATRVGPSGPEHHHAAGLPPKPE
ncbi:MAG: hypothetical protein NVS9B15_10260 [Acidobacteriaceae bacterium]